MHLDSTSKLSSCHPNFTSMFRTLSFIRFPGTLQQFLENSYFEDPNYMYATQILLSLLVISIMQSSSSAQKYNQLHLDIYPQKHDNQYNTSFCTLISTQHYIMHLPWARVVLTQEIPRFNVSLCTTCGEISAESK